VKLEGEIALVTGGSRGIGRAIALRLADAGARVVASATSASGAQAIGATMFEAGRAGRGIVLDVADPASIERAVSDIEAAEGAVTILVNNAGITQDNLAVRMKDAEWDRVMDTDLKSVFRLSRAVLRNMMKARRGRIVNVTSIVGSTGNAGQVNYAAAKAGIAGFTRALAREVASRGITVNCVAPGFIDTDMTRALAEAHRGALLQQIPAARLGHPEEVAAAVAFLASPEAGYITGTTVHVNGGMYMG
jgi:3-oxoacyl-[acyl-carrier protein] reductase